MFYQLVEILHQGYLSSPLLYKRCPYIFIDIPLSDLRVTSKLSPHYQRFPPRLTFRRTTVQFKNSTKNIKKNILKIHGSFLTLIQTSLKISVWWKEYMLSKIERNYCEFSSFAFRAVITKKISYGYYKPWIFHRPIKIKTGFLMWIIFTFQFFWIQTILKYLKCFI